MIDYEKIYRLANEKCLTGGYDLKTLAPLNPKSFWDVAKLERICKKEGDNP